MKFYVFIFSVKKETAEDVSREEESQWEEQRPRKFLVKEESERDMVIRKVICKYSYDL